MNKTISDLFDDTYLDYPATWRFDTFYALLPAKRLHAALEKRYGASLPKVSLPLDNIGTETVTPARDPFDSPAKQECVLRLLGGIDALRPLAGKTSANPSDVDSFYVLIVADNTFHINDVYDAFVTLPTPAVINDFIAGMQDDPFQGDQDEVVFLRSLKQALIQHPLN